MTDRWRDVPYPPVDRAGERTPRAPRCGCRTTSGTLTAGDRCARCARLRFVCDRPCRPDERSRRDGDRRRRRRAVERALCAREPRTRSRCPLRSHRLRARRIRAPESYAQLRRASVPRRAVVRCNDIRPNSPRRVSREPSTTSNRRAISSRANGLGRVVSSANRPPKKR